MKKLIWTTEPGNEYQTRIGSLRINLKPLPDGRFLLMDSKEGQYFRRERSILMGPLENAMDRVQNRYVV